MNMPLKPKTIAASISLGLLLLGMSATAIFASTSTSVTQGASAVPPAEAGTHGLVAVPGPEGISPAVTDKSVWAGYGQVEKKADNVAAGIDGWIVPSGTCNATSPYQQDTYFLASLDGASGVYAGIVLYCPQGESGAAIIYAVDAMGYYSGINAGDQVTAFVANTGGGSASYYIHDWTTGGVISDVSSGISFTQTAFYGIVDTGSGCSTSNAICPQVQYSTVEDGSAYDYASTPVACNTNPDGSTPAYPCVGYGAPYSSSTYFYAIGAHVKGVTDTKFVMDTGDNGVIGAPYYTATGALQSDLASHTYKFKEA